MTLDNNDCYEFGDFALYPKSRILTRFNRAIDVPRKDFDILLYLVQNAGTLVKDKDIIVAAWRDGTKIGDGNVTNHISKIRQVLNCDRQNPRFILTYYGKRAYRFIAKVTVSDKQYEPPKESLERTGQIPVESHLIAPVFLGAQAFENILGTAKSSIWGEFKEFKIDGGRLQVQPTGIGVWHLEGKHSFESFAEAAQWRQQTYEKILNGKHVVQLYNHELKRPMITRSTDAFAAILGQVGYVFSILVLTDPKWTRPGSIRKPLQLLSCLGTLEKAAKGLEYRLLDSGTADMDTMEFGSPGQDLGYASWDGLSYLDRVDGSQAFKGSIIDFEIAVQSTWWLAKCLYDICLAKGSKATKGVGPLITALQWQHARLCGIVATESTSQRTMIEAVLKTSRLNRLVDDTLKLYGRIDHR